MANFEPQKFGYTVVDPTRLGAADHTKLNRLYRASIEVDFPGRTPAEYEYLVEHIEKQRHGVNAGVGGPLQRRKQRYANTRGVVVQDERKSIVGYVSTADNVSSKRPFPIDRAEMWAKMHLERLVHRKWTTFASRAFRPELLEGMQDTGMVSVVDVAGYLALSEHDEDQPVSSYPWNGETLWSEVLNSWGLVDTGEDAEDVFAFGESSSPVQQRHYVRVNDFAPGLAMMMQIANKPGASVAMDEVRTRPLH
ncbi:MAG TPA: hypothetical protein VJC09_00935 [Candidatus Saccharimonadales bacterium]|nr:hypothetical protein [Candidatus Saccharimonadales bacterium]